MKDKLLKAIKRLDIAKLSSDSLADYAYALEYCSFASSVVLDDPWFQSIASLCETKLKDINDKMVGEGELSVLVKKHSMSKQWYDMRRKSGMEVFTRTYQWRIVNQLLNRNGSDSLAQILLLAECLEADNYAHNLHLQYSMGDRVKIFTPSDYASEKELCSHIYALSRKDDYVLREELIQIADYIQTEIVEKGETANHLELVNAILCTGMPSFDYPKIVKEFEKATKSLAKTKKKTDIDLAPYFYSLWDLTQKSSYLSRFEKTVRQCYLTLANDKYYPDLGIDKEDSASLASALQFLDDYRLNVWIINDRYDVDKIIGKYRTAL